MARVLPPGYVDERELTADERRALDRLVPPAEQTGDSRRDLVAGIYAVACRMRQHDQDVIAAGAVIDALYRDVQSWRRIEALTEVPFTTARQWVRRWKEVGAERVDTPA